MCVWGELKVAFQFCVFMLFFSPCAWTVKSLCRGQKILFTHCLCTVHGSHDTIYTFKNYFATVFSVFSFSNNKFNPNRPSMSAVQQRCLMLTMHQWLLMLRLGKQFAFNMILVLLTLRMWSYLSLWCMTFLVYFVTNYVL